MTGPDHQVLTPEDVRTVTERCKDKAAERLRCEFISFANRSYSTDKLLDLFKDVLNCTSAQEFVSHPLNWNVHSLEELKEALEKVHDRVVRSAVR